MARLPRLVVPDQPQHVIVRGNNRSAIFCADADYAFYLEKLQLACQQHGCQLHAYILMTNHNSKSLGELSPKRGAEIENPSNTKSIESDPIDFVH